MSEKQRSTLSSAASGMGLADPPRLATGRRMKAASTPAAVLSINEAMRLVEQAQNDLDRAAQRLSAIRRGGDLSDSAFRLRESAHRFWWRLNTASRSRSGMSLDSEEEPSASESTAARARESAP